MTAPRPRPSTARLHNGWTPVADPTRSSWDPPGRRWVSLRRRRQVLRALGRIADQINNRPTRTLR